MLATLTSGGFCGVRVLFSSVSGIGCNAGLLKRYWRLTTGRQTSVENPAYSDEEGESFEMTGVLKAAAAPTKPHSETSPNA